MKHELGLDVEVFFSTVENVCFRKIEKTCSDSVIASDSRNFKERQIFAAAPGM